MSALICVLYLCACNHPASDHDGTDGACTNIIEINDLGAVLCDCAGWEQATASADAAGARSEGGVSMGYFSMLLAGLATGFAAVGAPEPLAIAFGFSAVAAGLFNVTQSIEARRAEQAQREGARRR